MKYWFFFIFIAASAFGQKIVKTDSSIVKNLDEVVITATKSERLLGALPMPVTVISKKQIQAMGSLRLNDVLAEQTGLFIVNDHGNGVQVQGFSPDYTLILVDGEPLVGRTAGTLELSRLAVGNIKQIEIVKGPSSSLYGSEALAGVINIITESPNTTTGTLSTRYGTNQTSDISGNMSFRKNKIGFSVFGNRYATAGYDLTPELFGQTVTPFQNYTIQPKLSIFFSDKTKLSVSSRYFVESQRSAFNIGTNDKLNVVSGDGSVKDFSFNPSLTHKFNDKIKLTARFYTTRYQTNSSLKYEKDNKIYDETYFVQNFQRPEIQTDVVLNEKNLLTFGTGIILESVEATRYDNLKRFSTKYVFAQYEYFPTNKLHFIVGSRYDAHSAYRNQLSPKLSASYQLSKKITLRASAGVGYKAPDFRQLYLNFNNAVAGYNVFGSQEVVQNLARLQAENQISDLLIDVSSFGDLRPESSMAFNFGGKYTDNQNFKASINFFRNDIQDLIETQPVARKTNGQNVFSYLNLSRVFTQGAEIDAQQKFIAEHSQFTISAGYQYLEAKDKAVIDKLNEGKVFRRDPQTFITERVPKADYGGLMGRSKHSANVKLFYEAKNGLCASLRGIYRGRYGFGDLNGNSILDEEKEYVKGYMTWNVSASKMYKKLSFQVGIDNIFGFTDPINIPNIAGRLAWAKLQIDFKK